MDFTRCTGKENLGRFLVLALAALVTVVVVMSMVPPVSRDALVHHLAVPKLYLNHGGIYEIPFMDFSYYPMNLDLLYMIPLYFGNDIVPKLIHFLFALLTAWLIFGYLKKRGRSCLWPGGCAFFSFNTCNSEIVHKCLRGSWSDLFFTLASLLLMMKWPENDFRYKYLIYSGIMCGLALGTKYNSLVTFALLTLFIPFIYSRFSENKKNSIFRSDFFLPYLCYNFPGGFFAMDDKKLFLEGKPDISAL